MGFLDRLFGTQPPPGPARSAEPVRHGSGYPGRPRRPPQPPKSEDEIAIERYRYLLRTAPPQTIEQVHAEAFSKLSPAPAAAGARRAQGGTPARRAAAGQRSADARARRDPRRVHEPRVHGAHARPQRPAVRLRLDGRRLASLGTVVGYVIGSAIVSSFMAPAFAYDAGYAGRIDGCLGRHGRRRLRCRCSGADARARMRPAGAATAARAGAATSEAATSAAISAATSASEPLGDARSSRLRRGILDRMPLVALTGGIASGKSTIAARLAEHGAIVVDADQIVRDVQQPGSPVLADDRGRVRAVHDPRRRIARSRRARRRASSATRRGQAAERDRPSRRARGVGAAVRRSVRGRPRRRRRLRRAAARRGAGRATRGSSSSSRTRPPRCGGAPGRAAGDERGGCRGPHRVAGVGRGAPRDRRRRHRHRRARSTTRCARSTTCGSDCPSASPPAPPAEPRAVRPAARALAAYPESHHRGGATWGFISRFRRNKDARTRR